MSSLNQRRVKYGRRERNGHCRKVKIVEWGKRGRLYYCTKQNRFGYYYVWKRGFGNWISGTGFVILIFFGCKLFSQLTFSIALEFWLVAVFAKFFSNKLLVDGIVCNQDPFAENLCQQEKDKYSCPDKFHCRHKYLLMAVKECRLCSVFLLIYIMCCSDQLKLKKEKRLRTSPHAGCYCIGKNTLSWIDSKRKYL